MHPIVAPGGCWPSVLCLALSFSACGGEPSAEIETAPAEQPEIPMTPAGIQVARILAPHSPVFLTATTNGALDALALLAHKDGAGNPREVTGVAFLDGDDYLSFEYDAQGRPEKAETAQSMVRWFDYSDSAVTVERRGPDGSVTTEQLTFEAAELDEFRVLLPSVEALSGGAVIPKAAPAPGTRPSEGSLASSLALVVKTIGCGEGVQHTRHAHSVFGFGVHLGLTLAECTGWLNKLTAIAERYRDEIDAVAYFAGCVGGLASTEIGIGTAIALYSCPKLAEKVLQLINDEMYASRVSQGFKLELAVGKLVAGIETQVTLRLTTGAGARSLADSGLGRVVADLTAISGPPAAPLTYRNGYWQWTGTVHPFERGTRRIPVRYGDDLSQAANLHLIVLADPSEFKALSGSTSTVVDKGASVDVFLDLVGGTPPYQIVWSEQRTGHSAAVVPELRDLARFPRVIREPVRFAAQVLDAQARIAYADEVAIEVCGDGVCSAIENTLTCAADCADADEKLCRQACRYRDEILGCGDFPGVCASVCLAILYSLPSGDECSDLDLAYERCTYSTAAIALGCQVLDGGVVCEAEREAADACEQP
jgi:hypothetical protein